jgi:hypothetical protein
MIYDYLHMTSNISLLLLDEELEPSSMGKKGMTWRRSHRAPQKNAKKRGVKEKTLIAILGNP